MKHKMEYFEQADLELVLVATKLKHALAAEEVLALYKRYGIDEGEGQRGAGRSAGADSAAAESGALARAAQNMPRAPKAETAVVWKLHPDNSMEPVKVSLGITDHAYTEASAILKGELKEGDDVIIRSVTSKTPAPSGIRR